MSEELLQVETDAPGILDEWLRRLTSRKLMVWVTATALMLFSDLQSSDWVAVTVMYIGSQALVDLATQWKHGK